MLVGARGASLFFMSSCIGPITPPPLPRRISSQVKGTPEIAFPLKSDVGIVVKAQDFQMMEIAAQRHEVKGILIQRPELSCTEIMQNWVAAQEETHDHFATQRLLVHEGEKHEYEKYINDFHTHGHGIPVPEVEDAAKKVGAAPAPNPLPCTDQHCTEKHDHNDCSHADGHSHDHGHDDEDRHNSVQPFRNKVRIFTEEGVSRACDDLLRNVPPEFSEIIRRDATMLAHMLVRLCPGSGRWLTMQVEVVGRNSCTRWHQDKYVGRAIVTYNGPGTWMVDDSSVRYDQFKATLGAPRDVSDPAIVPRFEDIYRPVPNTVALMKGSMWPGIIGAKGYEGLTHKSPNIPTDANGNPVLKRLVLKVDIADAQSGKYFAR